MYVKSMGLEVCLEVELRSPQRLAVYPIFANAMKNYSPSPVGACANKGNRVGMMIE